MKKQFKVVLIVVIIILVLGLAAYLLIGSNKILLSPAGDAIKCEDSDFGDIPQYAGVIKYNTSLKTGFLSDSCSWDGKILTEQYCQGNVAVTNKHICDNTCVKVKVQAFGKTFSSVGKCSDIEKWCEDSDGVNFNVKGNVISSAGNFSDKCSSAVLTEYYCECSGKTPASMTQTCDGGCVNGACVGCVPNCIGKTCGDDGCGGSCGACLRGQICDAGKCCLRNETTGVCCYPNCVGKTCGWDGCSGFCGICATGKTCFNNQCIDSFCTDSDVTSEYPDGKNYYLKGTTVGAGSGQSWNITDSCGVGEKVYERYCQKYPNFSQYSLGFADFACPSGCSDGACISSGCTKTCSKVLKVSTIHNATDGFSNDAVKFTDVKTNDSYTVVITSEGIGTITIDGRFYDVRYVGYDPDPDKWYITLSSSDRDWKAFKGSYVVLTPYNKNANCGELCITVLRASTIHNATDGFSNDKVVLTDTYDTGITYTATIFSEGIGTVTIDGKFYEVRYYASDYNYENWYIIFDYSRFQQKAFLNNFVVFGYF